MEGSYQGGKLPEGRNLGDESDDGEESGDDGKKEIGGEGKEIGEEERGTNEEWEDGGWVDADGTRWGWTWPRPGCCVHKVPYGCTLILLALVFIVAGWLLILTGYLPMAVLNPTYSKGLCYGSLGIAILKQCSVKDCLYCSQDCWTVYAGITVVPNITVYFFRGTYDNYDTVQRIVSGRVGQLLGSCWYKNGGLDIMFSLYPAASFLIGCAVLVTIGVLIFLVFVGLFCGKHKYYKNVCTRIRTRDSWRSSLAGVGWCLCRSCRRRKSGYSDIAENSLPVEIEEV